MKDRREASSPVAGANSWQTLPAIALVALGGLVGSLLRWIAVDGAAPLTGWSGWGRPGLLAVNVLGAAVLGWLAAGASASQSRITQRHYALFGTGAMGGLTSYSALAAVVGIPRSSGDSVATAGAALGAAGYIALSLALGLVGALAGWRLGEATLTGHGRGRGQKK
ncbi:fluoride efflux transporter FluC [Corynebacterium heidelbergense]|uniref:Fluoride-specific ion channel FluC n=1 Tax=Corynebacterium heidelbergense TaxID=2055947 RepID=A0A364V3E4_9CORY|nr:CrcB family protein [Corynebacterium heidelbergense]RAV31149.1 camphor resistance protein CrcB [Corynebacterium heidelbergense]